MPAGNTLTSPSVWFREIIVPRIEHMNKVEGDYLEGTMMPGEQTDAGTWKFPIVTGTLETYKLSGAIQPVAATSLGIDYVQVSGDDWEVSSYLRQQDLDKIGPAMQAAVASEMSKAVSKRKDWVRLDALQAFMTVGSPPATIGSGAGDTIDILDLEVIGAQIRGYGYREPIFLPIPEMWMSQLCLYDEFAHADYTGPSDLPFSKAEAVTKRTWRGLNLFTLPDEYFDRYAPAGGTAQYTWAWTRSAIAASFFRELRNPSMTAREELEGTPYLMKAAIGGAALGINKNGVRRLHFAKLSTVTRPA